MSVTEVFLNSKSKYAVLLLSSVVVIYALVGGMFNRVSAQDGAYPQLSLFWDVWAKIQSDYVDEPSANSAIMGAVRGLIEQVDPNGGYLTAKDVAFYKDFDPLKTPGIGVILTKYAGYPMIVSAIPGGPADKAGLSTGDIIEAIDGITTREMNLVQVNGYLANPADKPANLTVIRLGRSDPEAVSVNRAVTKSPAIESKMIDSDIAYVRIPILSQGKSAETRKALDELLKKGASHVILDLRSCAGGEEQEAITLASLFVDSGSIGYLQGQKVDKKVFNADSKATLTKAPLAVLINKGTAGPAEIVAGAIGDSNRGKVVGGRTFGMGSSQRLIPMENGSALLISSAKYYTPSGKEIQNNGIRPQVEVASEMDEVLDLTSDQELEVQPPARTTAPANNEDKQLNKAIEILKEAKVTRRAA
jgi:carboxyl-terminal processing protease